MFLSDRERARLADAFDTWYRHSKAIWDAQPEWYVWVTKGQPVLTAEQYERVLRPSRRKS